MPIAEVQAQFLKLTEDEFTETFSDIVPAVMQQDVALIQPLPHYSLNAKLLLKEIILKYQKSQTRVNVMFSMAVGFTVYLAPLAA